MCLCIVVACSPACGAGDGWWRWGQWVVVCATGSIESRYIRSGVYCLARSKYILMGYLVWYGVDITITYNTDSCTVRRTHTSNTIYTYVVYAIRVASWLLLVSHLLHVCNVPLVLFLYLFSSHLVCLLTLTFAFTRPIRFESSACLLYSTHTHTHKVSSWLGRAIADDDTKSRKKRCEIHFY